MKYKNKFTKQYIYIFVSPQDLREKYAPDMNLKFRHCDSWFVNSSTVETVCSVAMPG